MALGRRVGKQVCRIADFGQQFWRTVLGTTLWSSEGEQLWGAALGSSFEGLLCTAALKNRRFGENLCGVAIRTQLWGAIFGSNFGEQLSAALGQQLWAQFCGAAQGNRFGEQLCTAALKNRSFGEHLCGVAIRTQLWGAIFGSNFGEQLSAGLGQQLWRTALGTILWSSAGEQLWEAALGRSFAEQLCTAAWKNFRFVEHLCERNFGEQLSAATLGSSFRESH